EEHRALVARSRRLRMRAGGTGFGLLDGDLPKQVRQRVARTQGRRARWRAGRRGNRALLGRGSKRGEWAAGGDGRGPGCRARWRRLAQRRRREGDGGLVVVFVVEQIRGIAMSGSADERL